MDFGHFKGQSPIIRENFMTDLTTSGASGVSPSLQPTPPVALQTAPPASLTQPSNQLVPNNRVRVIQLIQTDPYARGHHLGTLLKLEIQGIYAFIDQQIAIRRAFRGSVSFDRSVSELIKHLPLHIKKEMLGVAIGAGVDLMQVVRIHTFLDIFAGESGCSALGAISNEGGNETMSTVSTVDFSDEYDMCKRRVTLANFKPTAEISSYQDALRAVNMSHTIQSVIFDINTRQVHITNEPHNSALYQFRTYSPFDGGITSTRTARLARNLDWPWDIIAPFTILVCTPGGDGKHQFVNVTFPGFLGVLTGMNERGVSLACCQGGSGRQDNGEPTTILFRRVLENSSTAQEAEILLTSQNTRPASAMNLAVVGPDNAFTVRLDPRIAQAGHVSIERALNPNS